MWPKLMEWSERTIALGGGPRYHDEDGIVAAMEFAEACAELFEQKGRDPRRRDVGLDPAEERACATAATSAVDEISATACCCSTAAPRPPAP
jgi:hypothetical protein